MSVTLSINAFAGKNSVEFKKHYNAVKFCIENELSYPKETSEFFKGKVGGDNLEDISSKSILEYIKNGISIPLEMHEDDEGKIIINTSDIPPEADEIIISLDY